MKLMRSPIVPPQGKTEDNIGIGIVILGILGLILVVCLIWLVSNIVSFINEPDALRMFPADSIGVFLLTLLVIEILVSFVRERRYDKTRVGGKDKPLKKKILPEIWLTILWGLIVIGLSVAFGYRYDRCTSKQEQPTGIICDALEFSFTSPVVVLAILFFIVLCLGVVLASFRQRPSETRLLDKIKYISCVAGITFSVVLGIAVLVASLTTGNAGYRVGIIIIIGLLWLGGKFTWWQYEKARDATGKEFQKEKVRLEVWLATFGAIFVAGVFAGLQFLHDERIANRQEYRTSIGFLSSESPAVRKKGVEELYKYAKENGTKPKKEVWKLLNNHVKEFTRDKSYQESFPNKPASDIALILKIQSSTDYINEEDYPFKNIGVIDWQSAWLRGADLDFAQLKSAKLKDAQLQGANLDHAHLQGAYLRHAQLQGANLDHAHLQGADLRDAELQGADLWDTQLQGADLWYAQLQEADLRDAQLQGVFSSQTPHETVGESRLNYEARFEAAISRRAGQKTEVVSVVFEGEMTEYDIRAIEEKMNLDAKFWEQGSYMKNRKEELEQLLDRLKKEHHGNEIRGEDIPTVKNMTINEYLTEKRGATTGAYTEEEADEWIADYKEAVGLEE